MNLRDAELIRQWFHSSTENYSARERIEKITFAEKYAEPGYSDPESGVIAFGNWNTITKYEEKKFIVIDDTSDKLASLFEALGVEIEWSDEWDVCCDCGGAVCTQQDSYGRKHSFYRFGDEDLTCETCIKESYLSDYLEELEGDERHAITFDVDPEDHGYKLWDQEFENGFHPGQSDEPPKIAGHLRSLGIDRFVFRIDGVGQFDISFSVYIHESQTDKLVEVDKLDSEGVDQAAVMEKALREAPLVPSDLCAEQQAKGGVISTTIDTRTGETESKLLSPEEFVKGVKHG